MRRNLEDQGERREVKERGSGYKELGGVSGVGRNTPWVPRCAPVRLSNVAPFLPLCCGMMETGVRVQVR